MYVNLDYMEMSTPNMTDSPPYNGTQYPGDQIDFDDVYNYAIIGLMSPEYAVGRLEVESMNAQQIGTVCDDYWSDEAAMYVTHNLLYNNYNNTFRYPADYILYIM